MSLLGGAFAAGDDAAGLRGVKRGFGRTPDDDRLFALGYPHLVMLSDEPFAQASLKGEKLWHHFPGTAGTFPRGLAIRIARAKTNSVDDVLAASEAPLTGAALKKTVEGACAFAADRLLFLEAVTSSEIVADLAVAYIAKLSTAAWKKHPFETEGGDSLRVLHYILLRCPTAKAKALRAKLEVVFGKIKKTMADGYWRPLRGLDLCLHGAAGVKRSGYRPDDVELSLGDVSFAGDDPKFVAAEVKRELPTLVPNDSPVFDARLAFLGGPAVTKALCGALGRFNSQHHRAMVEQLGRIAGKDVVAFMKAAAAKPRCRVAATAWLAANA